MVSATADQMTKLIRCQYIALIFLTVLLHTGCDSFTDPATRIAYDIESSVAELYKSGGQYILYHKTPSKTGECEGPYKVQFDKVGALIVWCRNAAGEVVSSHSTSYHARFVTIPETRIVDKGAGETLIIELKRRGSKTTIVDVR